MKSFVIRMIFVHCVVCLHKYIHAKNKYNRIIEIRMGSDLLGLLEITSPILQEFSLSYIFNVLDVCYFLNLCMIDCTI